MKELTNQLHQYNKDLSLREIEGILFLLFNNKSISNSELIQKTGLPKETLRIFKQSISSYLVDSGEDRIELKTDLLKQVNTGELRPYKWSLLEQQPSNLSEKILDIRNKYNLYPKREFDQFFATTETTASKVMVMDSRGNIEGKRIALLGDDDLVSIALGISFKEYIEVVVFDVDKELLSIIEKISGDLNLNNIRTVQLDVRKELNQNYLRAFDVVITDPPYTRNGVELFLNTAIKMLKNPGYIYLYYGNSFKSQEKTLKVQEVILDFGLEIEDKINKFARYNGAESIGSASSLYLLKTTPVTKNKETNLVASDIYTYEDRKEEKFPYVDHYTLKVFNVPDYIINQKKAVATIADEFCAIHRLKVVDTKTTQFKGKGLSLTLILSNSNLSVHTWPEHHAVHIDLITCTPIYNKEKLGETASKLFKTKTVEVRKIE